MWYFSTYLGTDLQTYIAYIHAYKIFFNNIDSIITMSLPFKLLVNRQILLTSFLLMAYSLFSYVKRASQGTSSNVYMIASQKYHGDRSSSYGRHLTLSFVPQYNTAPGEPVTLYVVITGHYTDVLLRADTHVTVATGQVQDQVSRWSSPSYKYFW